MILAIDAGNSRTKWAVFGWGGERLDHGVWLNGETGQQAHASWQSCHRIVVSNVAGLEMKRALQSLLEAIDAPIHWVHASAAAAGVINRYAEPSTLGCDRWVASIGAWQRFHTTCVVVNAGTALTVDALMEDEDGKRGIFMGGAILPGLRLLQSSLVKNTHGIRQAGGGLMPFPDNTASAVHSGAAYAMAGAVQGMAMNVESRTGRAPLVVVSGGDAALLIEALSWFNMRYCVEHVDDLVLNGLFHLERECL